MNCHRPSAPELKGALAASEPRWWWITVASSSSRWRSEIDCWSDVGELRLRGSHKHSTTQSLTFRLLSATVIWSASRRSN